MRLAGLELGASSNLAWIDLARQDEICKSIPTAGFNSFLLWSGIYVHASASFQKCALHPCVCITFVTVRAKRQRRRTFENSESILFGWSLKTDQTSLLGIYRETSKVESPEGGGG